MPEGPIPTQQRKARSIRRYTLVGSGIVALGLLIAFGSSLRDQEPNYYSPARTELVNARMRFEESLAHEQALIEQLRLAHQELDAALAQLSKAVELDPAHRVRIEGLRSRLLEMEAADRRGEMSPEDLQASYRQLLAQMDALINELQNQGR